VVIHKFSTGPAETLFFKKRRGAASIVDEMLRVGNIRARVVENSNAPIFNRTIEDK
jgi:hypothetical protein